MGDNPEEDKETYEEVKAAVEPEEAEEAPEAEEPPEPPKPKVKPKAKPKEPKVAKPAKNDKVECADCGKTMSANTLRYKHVCKPPKSTEIQKEKPRKKVKQSEPESDEEPVQKESIRKKRESYSPSTPRTKMLQYYREARVAQQEQKRARYRSWLGND